MGAWTRQEDDTLAALIQRGHTFSEIARQIPGKSRNACLSRAHRKRLADLPPRAVPPMPVAPPPEPEPPPVERSLLTATARQCRWIPGDNLQEICGERALPGMSWCREHRARCYSSRRESAA